MLSLNDTCFYVKTFSDDDHENKYKIEIIEGTIIEMLPYINDKSIKFEPKKHKINYIWTGFDFLFYTKEDAIKWAISFLENKKLLNKNKISILINLNTYIDNQIRYLKSDMKY